MWWLEYSLNPTNPNQFERAGGVEIQGEVVTRKKPGWLVALKLLGASAIAAVVFLIPLWSIPLALWKTVALSAAIVLLYVGLSFLIRPRPNTDNLGWCGGLFDNPFQYNDDINRGLWQLDCLLVPGRFVADSMIDAFVWLGVVPEVSSEDLAREKHAEVVAAAHDRRREIVAQVEKRRAEQQHQGTVELSSARWLDEGPTR